MRCKRCGSEILQNEKFCGECGKPVDLKNNISCKGKKSKKTMKIAIVLLLISLVLLGFGFLLHFKKEKSFDINSISLDYQYLSTTDVGEYVISDANENISFEVTEGTIFKILDENNKEVKAEIIENKIINSDGYDKGKKYVLSIENGNFVSEQLEEANKVTFKIARDEVKKYKLKEEVIKAQNNKIQVTDNELIASNTSYKIGDVIVIYDGEIIKDAYVVTSINSLGSYGISEAKLDQIYSELDFYYEEYADLSNYETAEQIKEYVVASAKNSSWYSVIVDEVHAEPKISVELENVENGVEAKVKVAVKAGDNSLLLNSKYHDFELSYSHKLQISTLVDVTLTNWDVSMKITNQQSFDFKISNKAIDYDAKMNKDLIKKIQDAIDKRTATDSDNKELELVIIPIPTVVPGLSFQIELGLTCEISMSVDFKAGLSVTDVMTVGFDYGKDEEFKPLSSYNHGILDSNMSATGNLGIEAGIKMAIQLDFVGVLEGGVAASGGLYGEAKVSVANDFINDDATLNFESALGLFVKLDLELEIADIEFSYALLEEKFPLLAYSTKTVTFTDDGNTIEKQLVWSGQKLEEPEDPIKEGYIFDYWELDGEKYDFNSEVSDSFELTAVWKEVVIDNEIENKPDNQYTKISIAGDSAILKFKKSNPTYFWDSQSNFGALEIDTVLLVSKDGIAIENISEGEMSGIMFQTSDDIFSSDDYIKDCLSRWYGITNATIQSINHDVFMKHVKGESTNIYYESYIFEFDDSNGDSTGYKVELILYKNDYSTQEREMIISEYQNIIDTMSIIINTEENSSSEVGGNSLEIAQNKMLNELDNYSYVITTTTKMDFMDMVMTFNCKEDRKNQISYCSSSVYGVTTEEYIDYANQFSYTRVTSIFGGDAANGEWTTSKYSGSDTNNFIGLSDALSDVESVVKDGGTYYNVSIDSKKIAAVLGDAGSDIDTSGIISEDINVSMFVNSSNYIEKISFNLDISGIRNDVVVTYSNYNTTGSITIPADVK